jgi:hypothetical protein
MFHPCCGKMYFPNLYLKNTREHQYIIPGKTLHSSSWALPADFSVIVPAVPPASAWTVSSVSPPLIARLGKMDDSASFWWQTDMPFASNLLFLVRKLVFHHTATIYQFIPCIDPGKTGFLPSLHPYTPLHYPCTFLQVISYCWSKHTNVSTRLKGSHFFHFNRFSNLQRSFHGQSSFCFTRLLHSGGKAISYDAPLTKSGRKNKGS